MAITAELLASRFRGCMVGSLVGDCFGAPFEAERRSSMTVINNYFSKLKEPNLKVPYKPYTDDTAMTRCVASSLINMNTYDATDMARRFVKEFYGDQRRGYGNNVVDVFAALRATNFKDPYSPAQLQFGGSGSYGNGGGMRVAPVALFAAMEETDLVADIARKTARITHANRLGYNGAVLQCLAVYHALKTPPNQLDPIKFVEQLIQDMKKYEPPQEDEIIDGKVSLIYVNKLKFILEVYKKSKSLSIDEVIDFLGNDVSAPGSIPTAIYTFLRAFTPITGIETENCFQRTIQYAICLGGDTDTIASMAGSIAGAYHGGDEISIQIKNRCEGIETAVKQADDLHKIVTK